MPSESKPRVFICWSGAEADAALKDRLVKHLKVLEHEGELRVWQDGDIPAGADRGAMIEAELNAAAVAVFLISADSLASPVLRETQIQSLLKRRRADGLRIVPVLARPCAWPRVAWLAGLQQRPRDGHALSARDDAQIDTDLAAIATEIADLLAQSPRYAHADVAALSRQLDDLYRRRDEASAAGNEPVRLGLTTEIINRRRTLREAGQLQAGDFLGDGRYQLTERLGKGGFAMVWKAYDRRARRVVALKALHPEHAQGPARERFFRGARQMAALDHPGIVRVLEPEGEDGGWHYFVMEYVPGEDLDKAVRGGRVKPDDVAPIILAVAEALQHAHERGLVHRDVTPSNILLDRDRRPRLTDFDLVRAGDTTGGTRTSAMGKFLYAAPEVMSRPQEADARADVYSLGMTAVFAYARRALDDDVIYEQAEYLAALPCAAEVRKVLARAVMRRPVQRFPSVREFADALQAAASEPGHFFAAVLPAEGFADPHAPGRRPDVEVRTYAFDVVTVDAAGNETNRREGQAVGYVEHLGERVSLEMIHVPSGTFLMGSADDDGQGDASERPQHTVSVTEFAVGRFPVTQGQWRAVARLPKVSRELDAAPSHFNGDDRPAESVSWHDAVEFCARLSATTRRAYRLPSEAEWEYASRAGTSSAFCFGDALTPELANFDGAHGGTTPVGQSGVANVFGLSDVHGNVWEWCQDHWHADYAGAPTDGRAWTEGGHATRRVLRGGAWSSGARSCRSAVRNRYVPEYRDSGRGFRVVCAVSRTQR